MSESTRRNTGAGEMSLPDKRYEAVEIDGQWFVIDHRRMDSNPTPQPNEAEGGQVTMQDWALAVLCGISLIALVTQAMGLRRGAK